MRSAASHQPSTMTMTQPGARPTQRDGAGRSCRASGVGGTPRLPAGHDLRRLQPRHGARLSAGDPAHHRPGDRGRSGAASEPALALDGRHPDRRSGGDRRARLLLRPGRGARRRPPAASRLRHAACVRTSSSSTRATSARSPPGCGPMCRRSSTCSAKSSPIRCGSRCSACAGRGCCSTPRRS